MLILKNSAGSVFRVDEDTWAALVATARANGWSGSDDCATSISAADADAFAEALAEVADEDMADLVAFARDGDIRVWLM